MSIVSSVNAICTKDNVDINDCEFILSITDSDAVNEIFTIARSITDTISGRKIYLRGLIEVSNICRKNCYYCGIRRDNAKIQRYTLSFDEIALAIQYCYEAGFGSIVLQAGEQSGENFISLITRSIQYAKRISNGKLGITLSLGEQTEDTYRKWFEAGADRYLLRIETSDPFLYAMLHPKDHSFNKRLDCLYTLQKIGYQVGTGVMIGVPGQTITHLAQDVLFFKRMDVDMIGMGPYVVHPDTPTGTIAQNHYNKTKIVQRTLLMIALTRIVCRDVNIASTTALEVLDGTAVLNSFYAGANVKMINVTPEHYKRYYDLYQGKTEAGVAAHQQFEQLITKHGFAIAYYSKGDPVHFYTRREQCR